MDSKFYSNSFGYVIISELARYFFNTNRNNFDFGNVNDKYIDEKKDFGDIVGIQNVSNINDQRLARPN